MTKICRICKKPLKEFDDIIYRCNSSDHRVTILVKEDHLDYEHIRIPCGPNLYFAFEINYLKNFSQIVKIQENFKIANDDFSGAVFDIATSESQIPFYQQDGIIDWDFSNMEETIAKLEKLETFS